ncbi:MAG: polyprenyl diphosphate synthase [Defluviitaleaceae bacterium]|nr:polyprenyl diphosphate synthase [Defluviitaleaceae bacterium]
MSKKNILNAPLPRHIGIIMDGNGRWAKKYLMKREVGHRSGAQALKRLVKAMTADGFECLTVYAFSTENWKRDEAEVRYLMSLIHEYIQQYIDEAKKDNNRIRVIGDTSALKEGLRDKIEHLEELTQNNDGMLLNIAINYGGRDEIVRAASHLAKNGIDITESGIESHLDTAHAPPLDLVIRTSGEMRLSNFLLWQAAYAELYCTDVLWPDFKISHLYDAVAQFQKRDRRFGGR